MHKHTPQAQNQRAQNEQAQIQTVTRPKDKTQAKDKTKRPSFYKVILLNDDFTPMDFVISILKGFFDKNDTDATTIMLAVHQQGAGVAGVFTFELAETKVLQVNSYAQKHKHPLKCVMEKDNSPEEKPQ